MKFTVIVSFIQLLTVCAFAQGVNPTQVGTINNVLSEPSGLELIYNTSNGHFEYWGHNDAGYPSVIYSFRISDPMTMTRSLDVMTDYIDWEDSATDDNGNIYLGDFGNFVGQDQLQIVKIPDPNNYTNSPPSVDIIKFEYPFAGVKDTEAMVHLNGYLYLFSKRVSSNLNPNLDDHYSYCFRIPDSPAAGGALHTAELMGSFQFFIPPGVDPDSVRVTGADISNDKKTLALMCYKRVWIFSCFDGDDFFGGTKSYTDLIFRQYEGITFINNHEVMITKEGDPLNPNNNPKIFYLDLSSWIDSSCKNCEKLINGQINLNNYAWTLFLANSGNAMLDMNGGQAIIDISQLGTSQWHINLRHKSLVLRQGHSYRISFKAHADTNIPISVIANSADGSSGYTWHSQNITTTPTYYSHDFVMNSADDFNAYLSLNVGNSALTKVYFDDISLVDLGCTCPSSRYFLTDISNRTEHFEASNAIYASNTIESIKIIYDAGNFVLLNPGFKTLLGAEFTAYIDGCDGN